VGLPVDANLILTVPPGRLDVSAVETVLVGRAVKRPGMRADVSR
jgi:hypothetical protein